MEQLQTTNYKLQTIVGIIMGSDSDLPVMQPAADILKMFEIPFELTVVSAHRTPLRMVDYAVSAKERGLKVIIAGAGGAAHLPGMVASLTPLPVIGVPVKSSNSIDGWDSILSILQMPNGVPVATVALNAAKNAGLLAVKYWAPPMGQLAPKWKTICRNLKTKWMVKLHTYRLLAFLMVLTTADAGAQSIKLLKSTYFPHYSSASSLVYHHDRLYVIGDDAPLMLVVNKKHKIKDSLRLFEGNEQRLNKATKPDLEAAALLQKEKGPFLFAFGSQSGGARNIVLRLTLNKNTKRDLKHFSTTLKAEGIATPNIEGAAVAGDRMILSNRANMSQKWNHLIVAPIDEEKGFAAQRPQVITLQLPPSKDIIGISGLEYVAQKDLMLFTASTELTQNAFEDGEIGDSYIGYIQNFSQQIKQSTIKIDTLINLTPILRQKDLQKIESVAVEKVRGNIITLHLASDNDDGSSYLFRLRLTLPAAR